MVRVLGFQVEEVFCSSLEELNQEKLNMMNGNTQELVVIPMIILGHKAELERKRPRDETKKQRSFNRFQEDVRAKPNRVTGILCTNGVAWHMVHSALKARSHR